MEELKSMFNQIYQVEIILNNDLGYLKKELNDFLKTLNSEEIKSVDIKFSSDNFMATVLYYTMKKEP